MIRFLIIAVAVAYPFIIYFGMPYVSPSVMAGCLAAVVLLRALVADYKVSLKWLILFVLAAAVGLHWWLRGGTGSLMLYPVFVNTVLLLVFGLSLFKQQSFIESIARKRGMNVGPHNLRYLRALTAVWTGFFALGVVLSGFTVLYGNMDLWLLYNGLVSYLLMGVLFVGELIVRYFYQRRVEQR